MTSDEWRFAIVRTTLWSNLTMLVIVLVKLGALLWFGFPL